LAKTPQMYLGSLLSFANRQVTFRVQLRLQPSVSNAAIQPGSTFLTIICHLSFSGGHYSVLQVVISLQRHTGYFLIQIYLPCTLLVILSWVGFWLNREATSDRVGLGKKEFEEHFVTEMNFFFAAVKGKKSRKLNTRIWQPRSSRFPFQERTRFRLILGKLLQRDSALPRSLAFTERSEKLSICRQAGFSIGIISRNGVSHLLTQYRKYALGLLFAKGIDSCAFVQTDPIT
jgi:hypothetical protein